MTIPPQRDEAGVVITLPQIYSEVRAQGDKIDALAAAVDQMVAVNRRLDQHHDRLNDHGARISTLEIAKEVALAHTRPRAPWYAVVGAVVGILTGISVLVTLIAVASKLGALIG